MTTTSIPLEHTTPRITINRIGLWLFFISETMLFLGLFATRFSLIGTEVDPEVSQTIGLLVTSILLASSYTALRAEHAAHQGDWAATVKFLTITLSLGLVFMAGVAFEWYEAFQAFPPSTEFGTVFFTLTGVHAFHVLTGLAFLFVNLINARAGRYGDDAWPVEAGVKYWHFVDVVWVFLYPMLYLI